MDTVDAARRNHGWTWATDGPFPPPDMAHATSPGANYTCPLRHRTPGRPPQMFSPTPGRGGCRRSGLPPAPGVRPGREVSCGAEPCGGEAGGQACRAAPVYYAGPHNTGGGSGQGYSEVEAGWYIQGITF